MAFGFLFRKLARCSTRDGKFIVLEAILLHFRYPKLSGPELIRLAYWGTSGTPPAKD